MNRQMRNKAALFTRVSTIAMLAAAGSFGAVAEAEADCLNIVGPTTIGADQECARVDTTVNGDVVNNAVIGPAVSEGEAGFLIGGEGSVTITGSLINNNTILGGGFDYFGRLLGALTLGSNADVAGGIQNTGQIASESGNGINLGYGTSDSNYAASMTGNITNSSGIHGGVNGVAALYGTMSGTLINEEDGVITGGNAAVYISDTFTSWSGGIVNRGNIAGDDAGIAVGGTTSSAESGVVFSGGIDNQYGGTISSLSGPSIIAGGQSFSGGIYNSGVITQRDAAAAGGEGAYAGVGILVTAETFSGNIENSGVINGLGDAAIWVTSETSSFNGSINNYGLISSATDDGLYVNSGTFRGDLVNYDRITGAQSGARFVVNAFHGDITNHNSISGANGSGLVLMATTIDGGEAGIRAEITNHRSITGVANGVLVSGDTVYANFTNTPASYPFAPSPVIEASNGSGVQLSARNWYGNVTNDGSIIGRLDDEGGGFVAFDGPMGGTALLINATTFEGNITNTGVLQGDVRGLVVQGQYWGCEIECPAPSVNGQITNSGSISGGSTGVAINTTNFTGGFTNESAGQISGYVGMYVNVETLDGDVTNHGGIHGDSVGLALGAGSDIFFFSKNLEGNVTNTGQITGGNTGLAIAFETINGNFVNSGLISGGIDGVTIRANTITGSITNDGTIIGGGLDTGLYVSAVSMTGNVINNVLLSAASNALHVDIGTLSGVVTNNGTIEATGGGTAVQLTIGNGTTFGNNGLIDGDVAFGVPSAIYTYAAGNGRIEGSLLGQGVGGNNNDTIVVNGTHSFTDGVASNFSSFTVAGGGTALMGTLGFGGPSASAYSFTNVDTATVNGMLYIDQGTTLNVDTTYTQGAGGSLVFDLGAPGGAGFTSLTGVQTAGAGDYGQMIAGGLVTLSGTIGGVLDPAFASANPGLEEVIYNDVIVAGSIQGDFTTTALFANNSLFELDSLIDGNTVDLRVLRSSVGQNSVSNLIVGVSDPFDTNVADRTNGIGSGSCGLAGGGWCFNRFAANEAGATQVMTDASPGEDPFAWLRTGVRRVGETAVWGRGVGVWGNTDGEAALNVPGADFSLGGGIAGVDHVFTPLLLAGVAAQWTTTDVGFDGRRDNANVDSFELGVYGSYGDTRLYLNTNISYIWHDFEVTRFVGPGFARGDYDGDTFSAYVEGGKIFETADGWRIQPLVALSYARLETDAYGERGTAATLLDVFEADFDTLKGMIGGRFAKPFEMQSGRKWVPEARIIWSHEFMDDHSSHFVTVQGAPINPQLVSGETFSRDSLIAGAGVTAPLSDASTAFIDYDAGLNNDATTHTVSAGVRMRW